MADMEDRARGRGHVEECNLRSWFGLRLGAWAKRMVARARFPQGSRREKCLCWSQCRLPFGLDQIKWILSASPLAISAGVSWDKRFQDFKFKKSGKSGVDPSSTHSGREPRKVLSRVRVGLSKSAQSEIRASIAVFGAGRLK